MGVNRLLQLAKDEARPACHICGKAIENNYTHADVLLQEGLCFMCHFWTEALRDPDRVIIKGECYSAGPEDGNDRTWRGFGGAEFVIRWLGTGERTPTTNLWYRGIIPMRFLGDNPDTAEFVTK